MGGEDNSTFLKDEVAAGIFGLYSSPINIFSPALGFKTFHAEIRLPQRW
jgi:hypothetical protein